MACRPNETISRQEHIIDHSTEAFYLHEGQPPKTNAEMTLFYHNRNKYMVDQSDTLICVIALEK
jgi:hypothetical protein